MHSIGGWTVHYMNSRGALDSYIDRVQEALLEVANRSQSLVPEVVLDIEVEAARYGGIAEIGHSGYVPRPGLMRLLLDPHNENLKHHLGEHLERMIAHELHHALRWETVGYGKTLIGALVSEGLCGRFTEQLYDNQPELHECALTEEETRKFSLDAVGQAFDEDYDHNRWFFGMKDLPKWTGYTIGYELVGRAITEWNLNASELIDRPEKDFFVFLKQLSEE